MSLLGFLKDVCTDIAGIMLEHFFLHENFYSASVATVSSYISGFPHSANLLSPFHTSTAEFTAAMRQEAGIPSPERM